jgi:hypothetical protein
MRVVIERLPFQRAPILPWVSACTEPNPKLIDLPIDPVVKRVSYRVNPRKPRPTKRRRRELDFVRARKLSM